jgi:hypothetical protein
MFGGGIGAGMSWTEACLRFENPASAPIAMPLIPFDAKLVDDVKGAVGCAQKMAGDFGVYRYTPGSCPCLAYLCL